MPTAAQSSSFLNELKIYDDSDKMKNPYMDLMFMDGVELKESFKHSRTTLTQIPTPKGSNYSRNSYHSGNSDKYDYSRSSSERQRADSDESLNTL